LIGIGLEGDDVYAMIGKRPADFSKRPGTIFHVDGQFFRDGHADLLVGITQNA